MGHLFTCQVSKVVDSHGPRVTLSIVSLNFLNVLSKDGESSDPLCLVDVLLAEVVLKFLEGSLQVSAVGGETSTRQGDGQSAQEDNRQSW